MKNPSYVFFVHYVERNSSREFEHRFTSLESATDHAIIMSTYHADRVELYITDHEAVVGLYHSLGEILFENGKAVRRVFGRKKDA